MATFLASIAFAYAKTATSAWETRNPKHLDLHGLALSLSLTACISPIALAAVIGVPQTRLSVRRILCQMRKNMRYKKRQKIASRLELKCCVCKTTKQQVDKGEEERMSRGTQSELACRERRTTTQPEDAKDEERMNLTSQTRPDCCVCTTTIQQEHVGGIRHSDGAGMPIQANDIFYGLEAQDESDGLAHGVIPSFRFDRWPWRSDSMSKARQKTVARWYWREPFAVLAVMIGPLSAMVLSSLIPPTGFNCRVYNELMLMTLYLASYALGIIISSCGCFGPRWLLRLTFAKDVLFTAAITAVVIATVCGAMHNDRCRIDVAATSSLVDEGLRLKYPLVIFFSLGLTLLSCVGIGISLRHGAVVYMQRDDGKKLWFG